MMLSFWYTLARLHHLCGAVFSTFNLIYKIFSQSCCVWAARVLFGNLRHAVLFVFSVPVFLKSWATCQFNNFMNRDFNQLQRFILAFSFYSLVLFCSHFFCLFFLFLFLAFSFFFLSPSDLAFCQWLWVTLAGHWLPGTALNHFH